LKNTIHIPGLTGLRAFACLIVLMMHSNQMISEFDFGRHLPFIHYGHMGVDIFFLLSGYIICYVYQNFRLNFASSVHFLLSRFARIYPAYVFSLFFMLIIWGAAHIFDHEFSNKENWTIDAFFKNILMLQSWAFHDSGLWNTPAWSVSAEILAYLIFPISTLFFRPSRLSILYFVTFTTLYIFYFSNNEKDIASSIQGVDAIVRVVLCFFAGVNLFFIFEKLKEKIPKLDPLFMVFFIILYWSIGAPEEYSIVFFVPLILLCAKNSTGVFSQRVCIYFGKISYSAYIIHFPIFLILRFVYQKSLGVFPDHLGVLSFAFFFIFIGAAAAAGALLYHFVESPMRQLIMRRYVERGSVS